MAADVSSAVEPRRLARRDFAFAFSGARISQAFVPGGGTRALYVVLMLVPMVLIVFYTFFYPLAGFLFFDALLVLPAILIVILAKTAPEYVTALKLTLFSAFVYGIGLGASLAFWGTAAISG